MLLSKVMAIFTDRKRLAAVLFATAVGFAAMLDYLARWILRRPEVGSIEAMFLASYLWLVFGGLGFSWFGFAIFPFWKDLRRVRAGLLAAICLAGGFALTYVIPSNPPRALPSYHTITVDATGERNPSSQSSEVWVLGLPDNTPPEHIGQHVTTTGTWEQRDTAFLSYQNQPASLTWSGWATPGGAFTLLRHPWSGIVIVTVDGKQERVDLFTTDSGSYVVDPAQQTGFVGLAFAMRLIESIIFAGVLAGLGRWPALGKREMVWRAEGDVRVGWMGGLICAAGWLAYWLLFWPGLFSSDSSDQWLQIALGRFSDAHPAFHSMVNWLITRLWFSPAAVTLAQILAMSAVAGWAFTLAYRWGASKRLILVAAVLCAGAPMNGLIVNTLWKDVDYSIALTALALAALDIALTDGRWLRSNGHITLLIGLGVCVALFRHNGISAAFATPVVLLVFVKRAYWPRLIATLAATLGLWWFIRGPVYDWVGVIRLADARYSIAPLMSQLAAHMKARTPLTDEEQAYIATFGPLDRAWPYSCYTIDPLFYGTDLNWGTAASEPIKLAELVAALDVRNPAAALEERTCRLSIVWEVNNPVPYPTYYVPIDVDGAGHWVYNHPEWVITIMNEQLPGMTMPIASPPFPELTAVFTRFYLSAIAGPFAFLWRPAFFTYLLFAGALLWSWRAKSLKPVALIVPLALHTALLGALLPAQDPRYMYPAVLLMFIVWPALLRSPHLPASDPTAPIKDERSLAASTTGSGSAAR